MARNTTKINVSQEFVVRATIQRVNSDDKSVGSLLTLWGEVQTFINKHHLPCNLSLHDETRTGGASAKLTVCTTTVLTGSLKRNTAVVEALHHFLGKHGFDSHIVLGGAELANADAATDPGKEDRRLIEDLMISDIFRKRLQDSDIVHVSDLTSRDWHELFADEDVWTPSRIEAFIYNLKAIGIELKPRAGVPTKPSDSLREDLRNTPITEEFGLLHTTGRKVADLGIETIGDLVDYSESDLLGKGLSDNQIRLIKMCLERYHLQLRRETA